MLSRKKTSEPQKKPIRLIPEKLPPSEGKETVVDPIDITGKVEKAPTYFLAFDIAVNGFEKLAVSAEDIKESIEENASEIIDLVGQPTIVVTGIDGGYHVSMHFASYSDMPTAQHMKTDIENLDSRLKGRISKLTLKGIENENN